jgi:hypothetical protein
VCDEVLDQCVGVLAEWRALIQKEVVVGEAMTRQFPLGSGGPPVGGAPPTHRGPGGGALGVP